MSQFAKSSQHPIDGFIIEFDRALRSIVGATPMRRSVPESSTMNESELSAEEKNQISHRGQALNILVQELHKKLNKKIGLPL